MGVIRNNIHEPGSPDHIKVEDWVNQHDYIPTLKQMLLN